MRPELKNIQGLDCLTVNRAGDTAIVMLHGYGANMHDLFPLWELWDDGKSSWYFPNGAMSLPMGYYEGRAWFSIDVAGLERAMREGKHRDLGQFRPPEFNTTLKQLENFLRDLAQKHKKIILGGFSQGAMCTSHLGMIQDLPISGLILLSGNMIAEGEYPKSSRGLPFYQSHGTLDPILSVDGAKLLEQKLTALGFQGKLVTFRGGHEIPPDVINGVRSFLAQIT